MLKKFINLSSKNLFDSIKVTAGLANKKSYSSEPTFETKAYKLFKIDDAGPSTKVSINREDALVFYKQMVGIRRMESAASTLYKERLIRGFLHLYNGQEAVAVGMRAAMRPVDELITAYRCHGWAHVMGLSLSDILLELVGHVEGNVRGKGGSMHMYTPQFYGGNGIIGAQVPVGAGSAFALKYRGTNGVCIALYGDGAANQGQIYEVFNMGKLLNLPIIYVCENNGYGMATPVDRASANTEFYNRGDFLPGIWVDGMDVLAVREATRYAIEHASGGKGPIIMEMATYRYMGHSMSDPGTSYRTREEVQDVRQKRDPIHQFKDRCLEIGIVSEEEFKQMDLDIKKDVEAIVKKAKGDLHINPLELTWDVYSDDTAFKTVRNCTPGADLQHKRFGKAKNL